jgi:hypothetical protein
MWYLITAFVGVVINIFKRSERQMVKKNAYERIKHELIRAYNRQLD